MSGSGALTLAPSPCCSAGCGAVLTRAERHDSKAAFSAVLYARTSYGPQTEQIAVNRVLDGEAGHATTTAPCGRLRS
jgi:hypothetical protein